MLELRGGHSGRCALLNERRCIKEKANKIIGSEIVEKNILFREI